MAHPVKTSNDQWPHADMYYTPIVRHGFRQGAFRACIYITRRAYRCLVFWLDFWNFPRISRSQKPKREIRLCIICLSSPSPSRQGVGNEFDVAKLRIYLQTAKQFLIFICCRAIKKWNFPVSSFASSPFLLASITETERRSNEKLTGNERESNGNLTEI